MNRTLYLSAGCAALTQCVAPGSAKIKMVRRYFIVFGNVFVFGRIELNSLPFTFRVNHLPVCGCGHQTQPRRRSAMFTAAWCELVAICGRRMFANYGWLFSCVHRRRYTGNRPFNVVGFPRKRSSDESDRNLTGWWPGCTSGVIDSTIRLVRRLVAAPG